MSGSLIPNGKQQYFDANGTPLAGGKVYYYIPYTTTAKNTWQDINLSILNTNPIILDAAGECIAWGAGAYRQQVYDVNNNLIWDQYTYGINPAGSNFVSQEEVQTATQGQTIFTLTTITYTPGINSLVVFVNGSKQLVNVNYTETSSSVVTFASGLNAGDVVDFYASLPATAQNMSNAVNVAYDPPFTGSVATNVQAKLAQTVSVKDFGAVGDGVTDDTTAFTNALATSSSVFVPIGTYIVSSTLTVNTALIGENRYTSIIKQKTGSSTGSVTITLNSNATLQNLSVNINNIASSTPVVMTTGASNVQILNCNLYQVNGSSQNGGSVISGTNITDFKIINCYVENALNLGVSYSTYHSIYLTGCNRGEIASCFIRGLQRVGNTSSIYAITSSNINIHDNETIGGYILLKDGPSGQINNNIIANPNGDSGFIASNPNFYIGGTLNNNIVTNSADNGLSIQYCTDISVIGNTSINNNTSGLALGTNAYRCAIIGNTFANNGNQAFQAVTSYTKAGLNIYSNALAGNTIIGNHFFDDQGTATQQYGISNLSTHGQTIGLNYFSGNATANLYTASTTADLIIQNQGINEAVTFTPTIACSSGTITSYTSSGSYTKIGQRVIFDIYISITNAGSGSGTLYINLPFTHIGTVDTNGSGRQDNTGNMVQGKVTAGATFASVFTYNNTSVVATGSNVYFSVEIVTSVPST